MFQNNSTNCIEVEESTFPTKTSKAQLSFENELLYEDQRTHNSIQPNEELASFLGKLLQEFIAECIQTLSDPMLEKVMSDEQLQQFLGEKKFRFKNLLNFLQNQLINRYAEEFFGNLHWMRSQHKKSKLLTMASLMLLSEILLKEVRKRRSRLNL